METISPRAARRIIRNYLKAATELAWFLSTNQDAGYDAIAARYDHASTMLTHVAGYESDVVRASEEI